MNEVLWFSQVTNINFIGICNSIDLMNKNALIRIVIAEINIKILKIIGYFISEFLSLEQEYKKVPREGVKYIIKARILLIDNKILNDIVFRISLMLL